MASPPARASPPGQCSFCLRVSFCVAHEHTKFGVFVSLLPASQAQARINEAKFCIKQNPQIVHCKFGRRIIAALACVRVQPLTILTRASSRDRLAQN